MSRLSIVARSARIANYRKLVAALTLKDMSIKEMGKAIDSGSDTARKYYTCMIRYGVIQIGQGKAGVRNNQKVYALVIDPEKMASFFEFLESCQSVDEELSQQENDMEKMGTFSHRTVIISPAHNVGAVRDPLVSALFGEPVRAVAA